MLLGRRYRAALSPARHAYSERVGGICCSVWNVALEQHKAVDQVATGFGRSSR
jgi:hypothetical protein